MAFDQDNMGVLGYCNGFTIWYYSSPVDAFWQIALNNYFDPFAKNLSQRDMIFITDNAEKSGLRQVNQLTSTTVTTQPPL